MRPITLSRFRRPSKSIYSSLLSPSEPVLTLSQRQSANNVGSFGPDPGAECFFNPYVYVELLSDIVLTVTQLVVRTGCNSPGRQSILADPPCSQIPMAISPSTGRWDTALIVTCVACQASPQTAHVCGGCETRLAETGPGIGLSITWLVFRIYYLCLGLSSQSQRAGEHVIHIPSG